MQKLSSNKELLKSLLAEGVKIIDPDAVYIKGEIKIGSGTTIYPQVFLTDSQIGKNCFIGPVAQIIDSSIGNDVRVGFTAQIKRSQLGNNIKMQHHSYLGDAQVKDNVNIAAGVITCNFDGKNKNRTVIGEGAFIGCNVNLVAPLVIGKGCFIAAGSTIKANINTGEDNLIICREKEMYIRKCDKDNN